MNDFVQSSGALNGLKPSASSITTTKPASSTNFMEVTSAGSGPNGLQKKKKSANLMPTIRFELKLEPPTSEKCSEFNYNKLAVKTIKIVKKKTKSCRNSGSDDVQKKVQSIAKNDLSILSGDFFLEKCKISALLSHYRKKVILSKEEETNENNLLNTDLACETNDGFDGENLNGDNDDNSEDSESSLNNTVKVKKSRKKANVYESDNNQYKLKDFNYLGQGYDEDDSFIDNSEAIDDRVPVDMAPKKGGFYINKGNLKMENIEEQKSKRKAAKKEAKSKLHKKEKVKNDSNGHAGEDSSTDEDFNPNEMDTEANENNDQGSDRDENDSSSDTDSDSDEDSYDSDDDDEESEIDEVSVIEDQNLDEVKLRNKKFTKSNEEKEKDHESSCEIIEITSSSNSNSSAVNKRSKRRIVDDTGDEMEDADDNTAGKENIESKNPTSSNHNLQIKKRKRIKEGSNGATEPTGDLINGQPSSKLPRNLNQRQSPRPDDNESENQPASSNPTQNKHLNQSLNNIRSEPGEVVRPVQLPTSISVKLKELVEKFLLMFVANSSQSGGNVWTEELKATLFRIYKESNVGLTQTDKSTLFTYISLKTGKTKESLMRHCRVQSNRQQSSGQPQTQAQNSATASPGSRPPSEVKQAYYQKLNDAANSKVPPPLTLTITDLNEDLRNKLLQLENAYQSFKQKSQPVNMFFESQKICSAVHSVDAMTKITPQNQTKHGRHTREFTLDFLGKAFEMSGRDVLLSTLSRIRLQHTHSQMGNKIKALKEAIDEEMPKQLSKYKQLHEEYLRVKSAYEVGQSADAEKKKFMPPRKKFDWTVKIRDIYLQVVSLKMSMYRSSSKPPSQSPAKTPEQAKEEAAKRHEFLKTFLITTILPLWQDNWMQMNVLLSMSNKTNIPGSNQTAKTNQQQNVSQQPPNTSANAKNSNSIIQSPAMSGPNAIAQNKPFLTNGGIINLASKSGKQIKLEHQPMTKPQMPPHAPGSYQSLTPNPQKSTSRPTTPSQLNRSLQHNMNPNDNMKKTSPPIINLTNTRPNNSVQQVSPVTKKPMNQLKNGQQNSSMNLEKALNNAQSLSPGQVRNNKSPNTLHMQQQQKLQYLQQQFELNIFNAGNINAGANSQFSMSNILNMAASSNNYSKNHSNN